jgi:hypothetical protein
MNAWGLERVLHMARAMAKKHAEETRDPGDRLWLARQDAKIAQAERQAAGLSGEAQMQVRRRIAALKRARTLGPAGLRAAAERRCGLSPVVRCMVEKLFRVEPATSTALSGVADWCKSVVQTHLDVRL